MEPRSLARWADDSCDQGCNCSIVNQIATAFSSTEIGPSSLPGHGLGLTYSIGVYVLLRHMRNIMKETKRNFKEATLVS